MLVKFEKTRPNVGDIEVSLQTKKNKPVLRVLKSALTLLDENTGQTCQTVHLYGDSKDKDILYIIPSADPDARRITRDGFTGTVTLGKSVLKGLEVEPPAVSIRLPASWDKKNSALKVSLESVRRVLDAVKAAKPAKPKTTVTEEAAAQPQTEKPRRKRRTKAEMEAARAAEAVNPKPKRTRRTKAEMAAYRAAVAAGVDPFTSHGKTGAEDGSPADPFGRTTEDA